MKIKLKTYIALVLTIGSAALMPCAHALEQYNYYTASGTNYGAPPYVTNSAVITMQSATAYIPPNNQVPGVQSMMPLVTFLSVTADTNNSQVIWYNNAYRTDAYLPNTTTSIPVEQTNGFVAGQVLLVNHRQTDSYERLVLASISGGTNSAGYIVGQTNTTAGGYVTNNLVVSQAPFYPIQPGDYIWAEQPAGYIPLSVTAGPNQASLLTNVIVNLGGTGGALISGHHGQPLLIEVSGNSNPRINAAAATFVP